jgi:hypothetical protein
MRSLRACRASKAASIAIPAQTQLSCCAMSTTASWPSFPSSGASGTGMPRSSLPSVAPRRPRWCVAYPSPPVGHFPDHCPGLRARCRLLPHLTRAVGALLHLQDDNQPRCRHHPRVSIACFPQCRNLDCTTAAAGPHVPLDTVLRAVSFASLAPSIDPRTTIHRDGGVPEVALDARTWSST